MQSNLFVCAITTYLFVQLPLTCLCNCTYLFMQLPLSVYAAQAFCLF